MTQNVKLAFDNRDANSFTEMDVSPNACKLIAQWYGGYHAGDDYTVLIDGEKIEKDQNGEIEWNSP